MLRPRFSAMPSPGPLHPHGLLGGRFCPPVTANLAKQLAAWGTMALILAASVLAIAVLLAIGVYISPRACRRINRRQRAQLQASLDELNQAQQTQRQQYQESLTAQRQAFNATLPQQAAKERELEDLQNKLTAITGTNTNIWLLSQADFLVKTAGRKLRSDWDVVTASALLKSADASLAQNERSQSDRGAASDYRRYWHLANVIQIDFDDIILKLNRLTNQVDNLRLADNDRDESPIDSDSGELSGSIQEWR